jgi:hypothetical protein
MKMEVLAAVSHQKISWGTLGSTLPLSSASIVAIDGGLEGVLEARVFDTLYTLIYRYTARHTLVHAHTHRQE